MKSPSDLCVKVEPRWMGKLINGRRRTLSTGSIITITIVVLDMGGGGIADELGHIYLERCLSFLSLA